MEHIHEKTVDELKSNVINGNVLAGAVGSNHSKIANLKVDELQELSLAFLNARDSAIGAAAELGEMRFRLEKATSEIDSLVHQLNLLRSSRTWKAGRLLLLPLRAVRKVLRLVTN